MIWLKVKVMMIQLGWMSSGVGAIFVASANPSGDQSALLIKAVTFLCGVLTILFSLTFGSLLRHFAAHSAEREKLFSVLVDYRTGENCDALREGCQGALAAKLDGLSTGINECKKAIGAMDKKLDEHIAHPPIRAV
jgi:hypothetical protein